MHTAKEKQNQVLSCLLQASLLVNIGADIVPWQAGLDLLLLRHMKLWFFGYSGMLH